MKDKIDDIYAPGTGNSYQRSPRGGRMTGSNVAVPSTICARDQIDMEKRARRRTQLNMDDRERLRQKVQADRCVEHVWEISETLRTNKELSTNRINALAKSAGLKLTLLSKVLPDLKSTEISRSPDDAGDPKMLSTPELMELIYKLGQRPPIDADEAEYVEVPAPETDTVSTSLPDW